MKKIKVVIAEDHEVLANAYKSHLEIDGLTVSGIVRNGVELIEWLKFNEADVIVLDIQMPKMDGIDVAKYFVKHKMNYKILVVSAHHSSSFVKTCKEEFNILGFLTKTYCDLELTEAVIQVYEGNTYFSQMPELENKESSFIKQKMLQVNLSDEEKEFLALLPEYTYNEIKELKKVSYSTVKNTFIRIRNKIGVNSNIELGKIIADIDKSYF